MRWVKGALNFVDELVWLAIWLVGFAFVVVAVVGGASLVEIGLLVVLTVYGAMRWALTSNVWDWLHGREP